MIHLPWTLLRQSQSHYRTKLTSATPDESIKDPLSQSRRSLHEYRFRHSKFNTNLRATHFTAALHVLQCLKSIRNYCIVYGCSSTVPITDIIGYSDAHKFPHWQLALFLSSPKVKWRS